MQIGQGVPKNNSCTLYSKGGHDCSDDEVRPASARSEDAEGGQQHGEVTEHVVSRADPR